MKKTTSRCLGLQFTTGDTHDSNAVFFCVRGLGVCVCQLIIGFEKEFLPSSASV